MKATPEDTIYEGLSKGATNQQQQEAIVALKKMIRKSLNGAIKRYGSAAHKRDSKQAFEDLFQEVTVELFLYLRKQAEASPEKPEEAPKEKAKIKDLKNYCFAIARSILIAQGKAANKKRDTETPLDENLPLTEEVYADRKQQLEIMREALEQLDDTCKDLLWSKYWPNEQGKRTEWDTLAQEQSHIEGKDISAGTLRRRAFNCRKKLAELIKKITQEKNN